jgi:hypothetical protein
MQMSGAGLLRAVEAMREQEIRMREEERVGKKVKIY